MPPRVWKPSAHGEENLRALRVSVVNTRRRPLQNAIDRDGHFLQNVFLGND